MTSFAKTAFTAATLLALGLGPASAQQDPHQHSNQPAAPSPSPAAPMTGGMMHGGMMHGGMMQGGMMQGGMMPMMGMMMQGMPMAGSAMGPMGEGSMPGQHMADRIEGRLAFLKAELKITDKETPAWNALADALRANARKLGAVRTGTEAGKPPTLAGRLDQQEAWYTARLEGIRTIKVPLKALYEQLSEAQKATADELLGPHLGLGQMGMQQMPGRMPGPMPGRMQ